MGGRNQLLIFTFLLALLSAPFCGAVTEGRVIEKSGSRIVIDPGIVVLYATFDGSTTQFIYLPDALLASIENMTLERTLYGRIIFPESTNLTQDARENVVDLDSNVNISGNFISINLTALSSLRSPAIIYLYNLGFSSLRIIMDGSPCPSDVCSIISYSGGTLAFNVSRYDAYEFHAEQVTPPAQPTGGLGMGGVTGQAGISNFTLDISLMKLSIKQGGTERKAVVVKNIGSVPLDISIDAGVMGRFVAISNGSFSLAAGMSKEVFFDFFARENEIPEAYIGNILVKAEGIVKSINVIIEVKARKPLFDIRSELAGKRLMAGEDVVADITLMNMGDLRPIDVELYYAVKDFTGRVISFRNESLALDRSLSLRRLIRAPDLPDRYVFYARVSYQNNSAVSTDSFEVIEAGESQVKPLMESFMEALSQLRYIVLAVIALVVAAVALLLVRQERLRKDITRYRKAETEKKRKRLLEEISKAKKDLAELEKMRQRGIMETDFYEEIRDVIKQNMARAEDELKRLGK